MAAAYVRSSTFNILYRIHVSLCPWRGCRQRNLSVVANKTGENYFIRSMKEEDIPQVIKLRKKYNFHDAVSVYSLFMKKEPHPMIIIDDGKGNIAGLLNVFEVTDSLCTGGYRTIAEEHQGKGLTSKLLLPELWKRARGKTVVANTEYPLFDYSHGKITHFEKKIAFFEYNSPEAVDPGKLSSCIPPNIKVEPFQEYHLPSILDYDAAIVGYRRELVVNFNCNDPNGRTFTAMKKGKCVGYGSVTLDIQEYCKMGPLYADHPLIAEALLKNLLLVFDQRKGFSAISISNNAGSIKLFQKMGLTKSTNVYRIYTKEVLAPDTENMYGILDLEYETF